MKIPLNKFEQHIDRVIVGRGEVYYLDGNIIDFDEISEGVFEAVVGGTYDYVVNVEVKENIIVSSNCDCPYDGGPICKHEVAVYFLLRNEIITSSKTGTTDGQVNSDHKKKSIDSQIDEILEKYDLSELKKYLKIKCLENKTFRDVFLDDFRFSQNDVSQEEYQKKISSLIQKLQDWKGYISWRKKDPLIKEIEKILHNAEIDLGDDRFQNGIHACFAVYDELTAISDRQDDFDDYIYDTFCEIFDMLKTYSVSIIPEEARKYLFEYCCEKFRDGNYFNSNWSEEIIEIVANLAKGESEISKILTMFDFSDSSKYDEEEKCNSIYQVLLKLKGEEEANKYLHQNIENPSFRIFLISKTVKEQQYEKAISLCLDGIDRFTKEGKDDLVIGLYKTLLNIAELQKDNIKIIEYSQYLFFAVNDKELYYAIMKKNVPKKEWPGFIEELISYIGYSRRPVYQIGWILVQEKMWERLLGFVCENKNIEVLSEYDPYLAKRFPRELADLYWLHVIQSLKTATNQEGYKEVCRYLKRMISLGENERVNEMIKIFEIEYSRKKKLLEELHKLAI